MSPEATSEDPYARLFQLAPQDLASLLSSLLVSLVDAPQSGKGPPTRFHAKDHTCLPHLSNYLARLTRFLPARKDALLLSVIFIRRLARGDIGEGFKSLAVPNERKRHPKPRVNGYTIHRLVLSCLLVASKFIGDAYIPQARAAKVGGIALEELLHLEIELLVQLQFNLLWTHEEYTTLSEILLRQLDASKNNEDKLQKVTFDIARFLALGDESKVLRERPGRVLDSTVV